MKSAHKRKLKPQEAVDLQRVLSFLLDDPKLRLKAVYNEGKGMLSASVGERNLHPTGFQDLYFGRGSLVRIGGAGVVIGCYRKLTPAGRPTDRLYHALKITRPSLFRKDREFLTVLEEQGRTLQEFVKHAPLSHRNICRMFDHKVLRIPDERTGGEIHCPAMLLEWISSPQTLNEYLADNHITLGAYEVAELIASCVEALHVLHQHELIHWDVKADNVLVDEKGEVKITDLGNARRSSGGNSEIAQSTRANLPPELRKLTPKIGGRDRPSSKRTDVHVGASSIFDAPWLDLWMLAYELDRLFLAVTDWSGERARDPDDSFNLSHAQKFLALRFPADDEDAQYALQCIRLVLRRMLFPQTPTGDHYYSSAAEVVADLRKIAPEFGAAQNISELRAIPQHVIRLPWTFNGVFTRRVEAIFNSSIVTRVSRHRQLSTLKHVYPGAEHKRSEHIAGVLNAVVDYVRALYADRTNPFWRLNMERIDIEALLLAALLHDVGHIAFGHYVEEVAVFFSGRMHEDYAVALLDPDRRGPFGPRAISAIERDQATLQEIIGKVWRVDGETKAFLKYVAEIIQPLPATLEREEVCNLEAPLRRESTRTLKVQVLHSVISSAIDGDKLDYLIRDGVHCGVRYAQAIDVPRFLQSLTVLSYLPTGSIKAEDKSDRHSYTTLRRQGCIAVTEKGILPVESMLVARYQMFNSVYWNKTARAETAMLQFLIQRFIAFESSESKARDRLDLLTDNFRRLDDTSALRWLRDRIIEGTNQLSRREKLGLIAMCDALLGKRRNLYWSAFELQYRGPGTSEGAVFYREDARKLHDRLVEYWENYWEETEHGFRQRSKDLSLLKTLRHWTRTRRHFEHALGAKLNIPRLPASDGDILIDVPPRGRDQIRNVYVIGGSESARIIQQSSPIADAVSDAFRYWTRRIRVFLSPRLWRELGLRGIDAESVRRACHAVMADIVTGTSDDLFEWAKRPRRMPGLKPSEAAATSKLRNRRAPRRPMK